MPATSSIRTEEVLHKAFRGADITTSSSTKIKITPTEGAIYCDYVEIEVDAPYAESHDLRELADFFDRVADAIEGVDAYTSTEGDDTPNDGVLLRKVNNDSDFSFTECIKENAHTPVHLEMCTHNASEYLNFNVKAGEVRQWLSISPTAARWLRDKLCEIYGTPSK